jgi:F-type H+-transporting ATPase subunit epsilon
MFLEIITPDKKIFSGEVSSVTVPGSAGQFQILKNHAPIISSLAKGKVKVKSSAGQQIFEVNGGVVEVLKNKITVLAESAHD